MPDLRQAVDRGVCAMTKPRSDTPHATKPRVDFLTQSRPLPQSPTSVIGPLPSTIYRKTNTMGSLEYGHANGNGSSKPSSIDLSHHINTASKSRHPSPLKVSSASRRAFACHGVVLELTSLSRCVRGGML